MKKILGTLLATAAALGGGCSGINATKSVSPLDFLLPGLMQNDHPAPTTPVTAHAAPMVAGIADTLPLSTTHQRLSP